MAEPITNAERHGEYFIDPSPIIPISIGGRAYGRRLAQLEWNARLKAINESMLAIPPIFEQMTAGLQESARNLRDFVEAYKLAPEQPPEDPRERALWLRQHRSTGPDRTRMDGRR